ncbi:MAG: gfo/Idh/MocA family oxidoreductase, partial [Planctomycetota bacterium]
TTTSRREFLKVSVAIGAAAATAGSQIGCQSAGPRGRAQAGGGGARPVDLERVLQQSPFVSPPAGEHAPLRVGLIGCGGRGAGAAMNCVDSSPNVTLVAMGDLFEDRLKGSREYLEKERAEKCAITNDRCFVGFDAFKNVLACDVDLVILATPPHFRPQHLEAAVAAGKHVFMEKPVAVDPVGARRVIAASDAAKQKNLAIVCGTQRRHDPVYVETMRRILEEDAIGDIVGAQCYWNQGGLWVHERKPEYTDMEWQVRNWLYFCWLSGDHIVEQHVHNLDVINWAMGGPPVRALGMGGRQVRVEPKFGNIFDHFAVEYEYANGVRTLSMCRQTPGASNRVSEHLVGTKGVANPNGKIEGPEAFKFEYPEGVDAINPYEQEHRDLIASIRRGKPLNEGRRIAESTLTAIMGRMSAYTGREISWDWLMKESQLDLSPPQYAFGDLPYDPVPMPGQTKLV